MTFDAATGRVWIAVDLALDSSSGREKHTDPVDQGGWLFHAACRGMRQLEQGADGAAILAIQYFGTDPNGPVVLSEDRPQGS